MNKIRLSVVICTKNRPLDLERCLLSIGRQIYLPHEVVVVDASDVDTSRDLVEIWTKETAVPTIYVRTKPGLTKQRNIGIEKSGGDVLAFFDDDVILNERYFERMAYCFERYDRIGGATGYVINLPKNNKLLIVIRRLFMLMGVHGNGAMKRSGFPDFTSPGFALDIQPTEILSGCNMLYRRNVVEEFKFDEFFDGYSLLEDVEFSHRVSKKYQLLFVKRATLVHNQSNEDRIDFAKLLEMEVFNHYYIFQKNVKKSYFDWIPFWWSDLGIGFNSLCTALQFKNGTAPKGFYLGHLRILRERKLLSQRLNRRIT